MNDTVAIIIANAIVAVAITYAVWITRRSVRHLERIVEPYRIVGQGHYDRRWRVEGPDGKPVGSSSWWRNYESAQREADSYNGIARAKDLADVKRHAEDSYRQFRPTQTTYRWRVNETSDGSAFGWTWNAWVPYETTTKHSFGPDGLNHLWEESGTAPTSADARRAAGEAIRNHALDQIVHTTGMTGYSGTVTKR